MTAEIMRRIALPECEIRLCANGILDYDYTLTSEVSLEIARRVVSAGRVLSPQPIPALIRFNRVTGLTREARVFLSESADHRAVVARAALLIDSPTSRIIANFFLGFNKASMPTQLFTDVDAAVAWLTS